MKAYRPYALLSLIALLTFWQAVTFGFANYDDNLLILKDYGFLNNIKNVLHAFTRDVFASSQLVFFYRPLLTISLMLDSWIGGINPWIFHLTNILIHTASVVLLFQLLLEMGQGTKVSLVMASFLAVHPALSQAVAWIPGRNDTLLGMFALGCMILFIRLVRDWSYPKLLGHAVCFGLALFTKETAVILPVVCLMYLLCSGERFPDRKSALGVLLLWAFFLILWFYSRQTAQIISANTSVNRIFDFRDSIIALVIYFGKLAFPVNLSVAPLLQDANLAYGFSALVFLGWLYLYGVAKVRIYAFGLAWMIMFLAPTLVAGPAEIFLEHRLYVPAMGLAMALSQSLLIRDLVLKKTYLFVLIGLLMASATVLHSRVFVTPEAVWSNAVRTSPNLYAGQINMGAEHERQKKGEQAKQCYHKALALNPEYATSYNALGLLYQKQGEPLQAERYYAAGLATPDVNKFELHENLANLYLENGLYPKAEVHYREALKQRPRDADAYYNLGLLYLKTDREVEAVRYFTAAIDLNNHSRAAYSMSVLFGQKNQPDSSVVYLKKALAADPGFFEAHFNLAVIYHSRGQYRQATREYEAALNISPGDAEARKALQSLKGAGGL